MENTPSNAVEQNKLYNVALFIDYENVYKNLLEENRNVIRDGFFEKIREWCKQNNRRLVKIAVYCNYDNEDLHESYHQSLLQSYGVESIHTSNQGKNFADLQITIDVLTAMHLNDNIDEFFIMSNDKDMTPLLNNIRYNKRKVSVVTVGDKYNDAICSFSDAQIKYEDIIKTGVQHTYIDTLEEKIKKNLYYYFGKNKAKIPVSTAATGTSSSPRFNHLNRDFFCESQTNQCCLMLYEVYNCIKNIAENGDICFYSYKFNGKPCTGVCPTSEKEFMKNSCGLKDEDFVSVDLVKMVEDAYSKYKK